MITCNRDHQPTEWLEAHQFCIDASALGVAPGEFPQAIETDLGNGLPFRLSHVLGGGDTYVYRQELGCVELHVFQ